MRKMKKLEFEKTVFRTILREAWPYLMVIALSLLFLLSAYVGGYRTVK